MKRRNLSILLAYGVPWAFLALFGDAVYRWAWHYVLIFACMAMLAWLGVKTGGILLAGNALSLSVSLLCVHVLGFAEQDYYFKPFGAFGWTVILALASALVQWLIWKKQWLLLGLITAAVAMLAGLSYWLQAGL